MEHSGRYLENLRIAGGVARRVKFDLVVAFDFYDGPESGLAFHSSGEGLRFLMVGESKTRLFRAFRLALLRGNWAEQVEKAIEPSLRGAAGRMVFALDADDTISALVDVTSEATEQSYYVAIGGGYLDELAIAAVSEADLKSPTGAEEYAAIHRHIKQAERLVTGRVE